MNKKFKKNSNKEEKSESVAKKVVKKDSDETENKKSNLLSNKRMTFDFDNNIIDKLNNNKDSRTYISQTSSNAANSWNYAKVLSKEREFRSITNGNKYDNKSNKKEVNPMLLWLAHFSDWFSALNVFQYTTFRAVMAALTALAFSLLLGPWTIRKLTELKVGQAVRHDGPGIPVVGWHVIRRVEGNRLHVESAP